MGVRNDDDDELDDGGLLLARPRARRRRRTDDEGSRGRAIVRSLEETSHPSRGLVSIGAGRSDVVVGGWMRRRRA